MAPTLAYWNIRGLAEQSRLLLKYLGVEYNDKQYKVGPPPNLDRVEWLSEKFSLGLDFPNLPYYIDGDYKLTQSGAILEYIADRHGMVPDCKKRRAVLHMLQCEIMDLRMAFVKPCYSPDFEKLKPSIFEAMDQKLPNFEKFLGDKEWLTGDKINYPDFALCELLNQMKKFEPTCLKKYPKLQAYLERFELAEQSRLLLKYLGVEYNDKQYKVGPAPGFDRSEWLSDKFSLGLDFPNLPYYIDGDYKLTQSGAILEYIADRHGMVPDCKKRRAVLHMLQCEIVDLRMAFVKPCYSPDFINYPDFALCELLNQMKKFEPTCLKKYPKLQAYLERFEDLPALREYMASKEFKTRPSVALAVCLRVCGVMAPTLGYWDIRGLAEQSRLLLKYLGVEYNDKRYKVGPAPTYDRSEWLSEKFSLGLDFPNLPYYIDGDFKLTQSGAILEYIADRHGMIPDCKKRRAVLHMIQCEVMDLRIHFAHTCYSPDFAKLSPKFLETLSEKLPNFEKFLGDKEWLTGDKINYPDFNLCELLNQLTKFDSTCLKNFPKLRAYLTRFENLPALKDYMASKEFNTISCHGPSAHWRGDMKTLTDDFECPSFQNLPTLKGYIASKEFKTLPCMSAGAHWLYDG
ncbi:unnamed protein product [Hydatigera taeniaeformis]|uniref:glutathione transferase n=1 Tax=Hydatigena taeniaeformis TaxID=6205 RepID=A0A158REE0_HYDTA|nr:unnamed protein product [Hydatigera taeniaeformis]